MSRPIVVAAITLTVGLLVALAVRGRVVYLINEYLDPEERRETRSRSLQEFDQLVRLHRRMNGYVTVFGCNPSDSDLAEMADDTLDPFRRRGMTIRQSIGNDGPSVIIESASEGNTRVRITVEGVYVENLGGGWTQAYPVPEPEPGSPLID